MSACSDGHIKVWNYLDSSIIVVKNFEQTCYGASLHPSGNFLVAAFQSGVRLLTVLNDDMSDTRVYPQVEASYVSFSNGGHYFAYVEQGTICICDTWRSGKEMLLTTGFDRVSSFSWFDMDRFIVLYDGRNRIFSWSSVPSFGGYRQAAGGGGRERSLIYDGAAIKSPVTAYFSQNIGGKVCLLVAHANNILVAERDKSDRKIWSVPLTIKSFHPTEKFTFASTEVGCVIRLPPLAMFWEEDVGGKMSVLPAHETSMSVITASTDSKFLITSTMTGSISVHGLQTVDLSLMAVEAALTSDDILVPKSNLQQYQEELESQIENERIFHNQAAMELRKRDNELEKQAADVIAKFESEMNMLKDDLKNSEKDLKDTRETNKKTYDWLLAGNSDQRRLRLGEMDESLQRQIDHYNLLEMKLSMNLESWRQKKREIEKLQSEQLAHTKEVYEKKLALKAIEYSEVENKLRDTVNDFHEFEKDLEVVVEEEINQMMSISAKTFASARKDFQIVQRENDELQQHQNELKKEIAANKEVSFNISRI
jgi:WD40 repeat protein